MKSMLAWTKRSGDEKFVVVMETLKGSFIFDKIQRQLSKKEQVLEGGLKVTGCTGFV